MLIVLLHQLTTNMPSRTATQSDVTGSGRGGSTKTSRGSKTGTSNVERPRRRHGASKIIRRSNQRSVISQQVKGTSGKPTSQPSARKMAKKAQHIAKKAEDKARREAKAKAKRDGGKGRTPGNTQAKNSPV